MQLLPIIQTLLLFAGLAIVGGAVALHSLATVAAGHLFLFAAGAAHLWQVIARRTGYWSLCDIQAASLLISYFGGSAITLLLAQGGIIGDINIPQLSTIFNASVYIVFFAVCLYAFGRIETPIWRRVFRQDLSAQWPGWLPVAGVALGGLLASQLVSGAISVQGAVMGRGDELPVYTAFIIDLSWPMIGLCGWILGSAVLRRRPLFLMSALAILPIEIASSFAHGRRVILFQALIFVTCFAWSRGRGFGARQLVLTGAAALPVVYLLWVVFLALRLEGYQHNSPAGQGRDLLTRLESASTLMESRWDTVAKTQEKEVVNRVFVLGYLVDLMDNAKLTNRFDGKVLLSEVINAVPRFLLPQKKEIMRSLDATEAAIGLRYSIGTLDRAMSVVTAAYVDFRWFGPVIFSSLTFMLGAVIAGLATLIRLNFFSVYVISYVFLKALGTEGEFLTDKLVMLRLLVVLFAVLGVYKLFRRLVAAPFMVRRPV